ncbi:MAG: glutathione S-transferase family protein [Sandaracinaceae bacterium]
MGRLIEGEWVTEDIGTDKTGRFVRRETRFRDRIEANPEARYPAARGRYHLYLAHACGWCHRVWLLHQMKGLEDVVSVSFVEPYMGDDGWSFAPGTDPVLKKALLREVYVAADAKYTGRVTVPVLWDRETATIVSNESADITRFFDRELDAFAAHPERRMFPEALDAEVSAMIDANYGPVNNGVYRCGFAGSQEAYDEAAHALFERLDALEAHLATRRYLVGDTLTAADLFLFPTLYRFDAVYAIHFKCSRRRLVDYPHLWAFTRDLYQHPGVAETCDLPRTMEHYYASHGSVHPRAYVPLTPDLDFDAPHGRDAL